MDLRGDLLNYQETERAGFLNQSDILREEDLLSLLPRALSAINETCPYKTAYGHDMSCPYVINHRLPDHLNKPEACSRGLNSPTVSFLARPRLLLISLIGCESRQEVLHNPDFPFLLATAEDDTLPIGMNISAGHSDHCQQLLRFATFSGGPP